MGTAEVCEVCGRRPAKFMKFKAHQGFLIARRELTIEGIFCRDHAIEAAATSRGQSLKGMWFSPTSLVLGTLRSIFDATKLLDLPDEVTDEPWVPAKVACPNCAKAIFSAVGRVKCEQCQSNFSIVSCSCCRRFKVCSGDAFPDEISVICEYCKSRSLAPSPGRNWYVRLIGICITDSARSVAIADGSVNVKEIEVFRQAMGSLFGERDSLRSFLCTRFTMESGELDSDNFRQCVANADKKLVEVAFRVSLAVANADGELNRHEIGALRLILMRFGVDPDSVFSADSQRASAANEMDEFFEVLGISVASTLAEVKSAYRLLAMRWHPDRHSHLSESERTYAEKRMQELNDAYERIIGELR